MSGYTRLNWWPGNLRPYESVSSFIARFGELNGISGKECREFIAEFGSATREIALQRLAEQLNEPLSVIDSVFYPSISLSDCGEYRLPSLKMSRSLRYCPDCATHGFHSYLHEIPWLGRCPFHGAALKEHFSSAGIGAADTRNSEAFRSIMTERNGQWPRVINDNFSIHEIGCLELLSDWCLHATTAAKAMSEGEIWRAGAFDGTRTWTYSYHPDNSTAVVSQNLDKVVLPDGTRWLFTNTDTLMPGATLNSGDCSTVGLPQTTSYSGSMVHPSGAIGGFSLAPTIHGRSDVPYDCPIAQRVVVPSIFYTYSLTSKTISGPGLAPLTWSYDYGPPNASWSPCTGSCLTTKTVTVTDPKNETTRHTFGNQYRVSEGKLQEVEVGGRITSTRYAIAGPYPSLAGYADDPTGDADVQARLAPVDRTVISQQGETFTWEATQFNEYAKPTQVTRSSSLGMSRSETTVYSHILSQWLLNQLVSVTDQGTGIETLRNAYNATTGTLTSVTKFGLPQRTFAYNADGTVSSVQDGLNQATTLSSYKRGKPQLINFPNTTSESAVIDNLGNFTSITDASGALTAFGYDGIGRLNLVTPPTFDTVGWNATTLLLESVPSAEYGLPAGHWRQTVSTGNARTVTYMDALWRPLLTSTYDTANEASTRKMVLHRFDHDSKTTFESYPQRSIVTVDDTVDGIATAYDQLGRKTLVSADSELGRLDTSYQYLSGFKTNVTNPNQVTTTTAYFAWDQPSEDAIRHIDAPMGVSVDIARDTFGKTLSITRSGAGKSATRSYVYDQYARLCKTIEPETGATIQLLDNANNVTWRASGSQFLATTSCDTASIAATQKMSFTYDRRNRLLTTTFGDGGPAITRTLTGVGRPSRWHRTARLGLIPTTSAA